MKKRSIILISAAAVFLVFLSIGTLIKTDVDFSPEENRYLAYRPVFNVKNVLDGTFESRSEEYLSDQIIGRKKWVEMKSFTEAALGVSDINGIYLCTGGRAVERITEADFDRKNYEKNLKQAAELRDICSEKDIPVQTMLVPTAAYVYADKLPDHALLFDEDEAFKKAEEILGDSLIDIRNSLIAGKSRGDVFFRTDHHWTGLGAFIGSREFAAAAGIQVSDISAEDDDFETLSTDFKGTLYSKVLLDTLGTDIIETSARARKADMQVKIEGKTYDSLYFDEYLSKKDKYAVYFGGNFDEVNIRSGVYSGQMAAGGEAGDGSSAGLGGRLLIIKDSFANSMVPFLLDEFSEITMVDTRFYRGDISELAQEYDRVLILYGIKNFAQEKMVLTGSLLK